MLNTNKLRKCICVLSMSAIAALMSSTSCGMNVLADGDAAANVNATTTITTTSTIAAPKVTEDDNTDTISGLTVGMEYAIVNPKDGEINYITYKDGDQVKITGSRIVLVRFAAHNGSEASQDTVLIFTADKGAAPSVSADDDNDKIVGLAEGMEYKIDDEDYYTPYEPGDDLPDLSGYHTVYVRTTPVDGETNESDDVVLQFAPKAKKPNVKIDDVKNKIIGLAEGMEYKVDDEEYYTPYEQGDDMPDFSGNHTVFVRAAEQEGKNSTSDSVELKFTINKVQVKKASIKSAVKDKVKVTKK